MADEKLEDIELHTTTPVGTFVYGVEEVAEDEFEDIRLGVGIANGLAPTDADNRLPRAFQPDATIYTATSTGEESELTIGPADTYDVFVLDGEADWIVGIAPDFPHHRIIEIHRLGTGDVHLSMSGFNIPAGFSPRIGAQYAAIGLRQIAPDVWAVAYGTLAPAA